MPLPKRPTVPSSRPKESKSKDSRFASFETDPKFRLPSKKHAKTKLDPRFSRLRTDPDFQNKASVDRYGRKISKEAGRKDLERMYELDSEASEDEQSTAKGRKRDQAVRRELAKVQEAGFDPIRDGGLPSSSDESSGDEEEDSEVEDQAELAGQASEVPMGDVTARLAAVNMDWDNIRATDLLAVASSFVPAEGRIVNVTIYPSDFGLERIQREEIEGPPREIFAASKDGKKHDITSMDQLENSSSEDEELTKETLLKENDAEEFDSKALRTYQLDRLRYYYAVISCSSPNVAKSIYDNLDGREYLSSANFFDLRFVPDGVDFDAEPHEECEDVPNGYKPNEFVTDALSHSKVKLTWDADDTTRKEAQKRAFSRKEIDENELQAYIGNESSSEDEAEAPKADKAASLRAALGLASASKTSLPKNKSSSKRDRDFKKPDGEMEVTFTSGLSAGGGKGSVFENDPEENTLEKYIRKQKERKEKRKERTKALKEGRDPDVELVAEGSNAQQSAGEEDPWNDPFFGSDAEAETALQIDSKKSKKAKKRAEQEKAEQEAAAERANLELLMVDDKESNVHHFDMNEIMKAEKAKKKGKKGRKAVKDAPEDDFKINTDDPRFANLFESHDFAIDPSNPKFKGTAGMKALLEEGRKKRKRGREDEPEQKKLRKEHPEADDLKRLAARVKAKSKVT